MVRQGLPLADSQLDVASDHYLGQVRRRTGLAAAETYSVQQTFDLPRGLLGAFYVIVLTDIPDPTRPRGHVIESLEVNNAAPSDVPTIVVLPPPSDLQVDQVIVPLEPRMSGDPVTVEWVVELTAPNPPSDAGRTRCFCRVMEPGIWAIDGWGL